MFLLASYLWQFELKYQMSDLEIVFFNSLPLSNNRFLANSSGCSTTPVIMVANSTNYFQKLQIIL